MSEKMKSSLKALTSVLTEEEELFEIPGEGSALYQAFAIVGKQMGMPALPSTGGQKPTLDALCKASGMRHRSVRLTEKWWKEKHGHLIGFLNESLQPVALIDTPVSGYLMVDPAANTKEQIDEKGALKLLNLGSMIYQTLPDEGVSGVKLFRFIFSGFQRDYVILFLVSLFALVLTFIFPLANKVLFDNVIPNFHITLYIQVMLALAVSVVSSSLFSFFRSMIVLRLQGLISNRSEMSLWDRLFKLPVAFFKQFTSGDLIQRTMLIENIQQSINNQMISVFINAVFSFLYLIVMAYYSWQLSLIGLFIACFSTVFLAVLSFKKIRYDRLLLESSAKINGFLNQAILAISKIRIAAAENTIFKFWSHEFAANQRFQLKSKNLQNIGATYNAFLSVLAPFLLYFTVVVFMGVDTEYYDTRALPITIGTFLAFNAAFGPFVQALSSLGGFAISVVKLVPYWERIRPIFQASPETTSEKKHPGTMSGSIKVNCLYFRYHKHGSLILDDINFEVKPGEFAAISGPSGCGKSTLMRLLIGFENPESGAIYYDGHRLFDLNLDEMRQQVSALLQNFSIFFGSIYQNIVCNGIYTPEEVQEAIRLSTFEEDVEQMPMGIHTLLQSGGGTLSGGQRQRLLLARALIKKPKILILDEATRMLDIQSENRVMKNIERLGISRIVISHRANAIKNADTHYMIKDGKLTKGA